MLSIILNLSIVIAAIGAVYAHGRNNPISTVLRYFTVLSNLLCAIAAVAVVVGRLSGNIPEVVLILKYVGTCAVTVTLLTVLLFLGPTIGYKILVTGPDFWLHIFCPIIAIVSYIAFDKTDAGIWVVLLGMLPVIAYGFLYLNKVLREKTWDDFYGFNKGGRWKISFVAMMTGSFLISLVLWVFQRPPFHPGT